MKKFFKNALAVALAVLCVLSSTSAFAAELGETLIWTFWDHYFKRDYDLEYSYGGEVGVGETTVSAPDENDYFYYVFNAENDGYYMLSFSGEYGIRSFNVADEITEKGVKYEKKKVYTKPMSDDFLIKELYWFEADEMIVIGFKENNNATSIQNAYFEIEYYGNAVSLDYDESVFNEIVSGADYYYYGETKDTHLEVRKFDITANFSEGQNITLEDQNMTFEYINPPVEGANKLKFELFGIEEVIDATIYSARHYISDIEIVNEKDLIIFRNENGQPSYSTAPDVNLKITYPDGKTKTFYTSDTNRVTFSNGREYVIYVSYINKGEDNFVLHISIGDEVYQEYPCTVRERTFADTFAEIADRISRFFSDFFKNFLGLFSLNF